MAEYIDREAFSEVLETAIKIQELAVKMMDVEDDPEFQMSLKVYSDILNGVKEFPAADVVERPRWISVKERMPEDGKNVLAYEGGGFYFLDWCCDGDWVVASASTAVVTHWMPLPEPPEYQKLDHSHPHDTRPVKETEHETGKDEPGSGDPAD